MGKVIEASAYLKTKNAENNFDTWFDSVFGVLGPKYMIVFSNIVKRLCAEAWNKCNTIWMGRYVQIKNNIGDAIELCTCDNSDCESCKILKAVLLQSYE